MWICHSERPLGAEELCQALAVEIGSTDYNGNKVPSIRTVLSSCQGLVVDEEGSAVRLIHSTLQDYLTSHLKPLASTHSAIAETCLTYLNSQQVMALSDCGLQSTQYSPFLEYSSLYWGVHMKKQPSVGGKTIAMRLFSHYENHISVSLLGRHTQPWYSHDPIERKFTGLHYASMFGLVEVARALLEMDGVDINALDETEATPILWAAWSGHEYVTRLLLGRPDANPDRLDSVNRTPLSRAAEKGHEAVVKLLLGRNDVNPDRPDREERAPISWAAENGHQEVVELLLGREDVNPDRRGNDGRTPISWAARNGHEAVVELLRGREGNPNSSYVRGILRSRPLLGEGIRASQS